MDELERLLGQLRAEDRKASEGLDAEFQSQVRDRIADARGTARPAAARGGWREVFWMCTRLLQEPRWLAGSLACSAVVALGTAWLMAPYGEGRRTERALSLEVFEPFPPHAPERLLVSRFSHEH